MIYEVFCYKFGPYTVCCPLNSAADDDKVDSKDSIRMTYVPSHLYHMLFELFKVRGSIVRNMGLVREWFSEFKCPKMNSFLL